MEINFGRAAVAGVVGTIVMTVVGLYMAPMMGMPLFSGDATMAMGSLVGHLVYGALVGVIYGEVSSTQAAASPA